MEKDIEKLIDEINSAAQATQEKWLEGDFRYEFLNSYLENIHCLQDLNPAGNLEKLIFKAKKKGIDDLKIFKAITQNLKVLAYSMADIPENNVLDTSPLGDVYFDLPDSIRDLSDEDFEELKSRVEVYLTRGYGILSLEGYVYCITPKLNKIRKELGV